MSTSIIKKTIPTDIIHTLSRGDTNGTVSFTFNSRGAAIVFVHVNGLAQASVYAATCSNAMVAQMTLLAGSERNVSTDGATITITAGTYGGITVISQPDIS